MCLLHKITIIYCVFIKIVYVISAEEEAAPPPAVEEKAVFTCHDLLQSGLETVVIPEDTDAEPEALMALEQCIFNLGQSQLDKARAEELWNILVFQYGSIEEIPQETLINLGWVITGIPPTHFLNLTLYDIDTVEAFGKYHDLDMGQLQALAERVLEDWANKTPEDYSHFDMMALGHILCGFNKTDILRIHAKSYKHAATELSALQKCPLEVLQGLAELAVQPEAFGPPNEWTKLQVTTIGVVRTGLDPQSLQSIPSDSLPKVTNEEPK